jgi:hypothetical protein
VSGGGVLSINLDVVWRLVMGSITELEARGMWKIAEKQ